MYFQVEKGTLCCYTINQQRAVLLSGCAVCSPVKSDMEGSFFSLRKGGIAMVSWDDLYKLAEFVVQLATFAVMYLTYKKK